MDIYDDPDHGPHPLSAPRSAERLADADSHSILRLSFDISRAIGALFFAVNALVRVALRCAGLPEHHHHHHPHPHWRVQGSLALTLSQFCTVGTRPGKGTVMYVVKANQPPVQASLIYKVVDSEGNVVPATGLTVTTESDNPAAVAVIADPGGDQNKFSIEIGGPDADGNPAVANLTAKVALADGTVVGMFGAQFTVTGGDPAGIIGGVMGFEGLSEVPEPPDTTAPASGARSRRG